MVESLLRKDFHLLGRLTRRGRWVRRGIFVGTFWLLPSIIGGLLWLADH